MNSESRVSVRWPVLVVAAVVLLAVGAGAAYVGLRSRLLSRPSSIEQPAMPGPPSPSAVPAAPSSHPPASAPRVHWNAFGVSSTTSPGAR